MKIKTIILSIWLSLLSFYCHAQSHNQSTFSEFYMGFYMHDILELKDSTFLFFSERNDRIESSRGMRMYRIDNQGDVLDSASFFLNEFWRMEQFFNGGSVFVNDSMVISGFNTTDTQLIRETVLLKIKTTPVLDTVQSKKIEVSYPDSFYTWNEWGEYRARTISNLKNGNVMLSGELVGNEGFRLPYFAEVDEDLNVVNSFYVFDSIFGYRVQSFQELNDGTYIISGQTFHYGDLFQQLRFSTRAFIARIDSNGQFIWRDIIRTGAPSDRNFWASDRPATFDMSTDSTLGLAYFQHLACTDSATSNTCGSSTISSVIVGRYRFMSYDLDGNVLSDKSISPSNLIVWRGYDFTTDNIKAVPKGGGYVFAGNYISDISMNAGFVSRLSPNGDSIWWREPRLRLSNPFEDFMKLHMVKETSEGGFIGVGIKQFLLSLATNSNNMQRSFVFKLDSNGCYEPGICPTSMLGVEDRVFSSVDGVKIYPNPADRILNIELEGIQGECKVVLRNMQGQTIVTKVLDDTYGRTAKTEFDVQHIAAGLYIVEVHGKQGLLQTKKVLIK